MDRLTGVRERKREMERRRIGGGREGGRDDQWCH